MIQDILNEHLVRLSPAVRSSLYYGEEPVQKLKVSLFFVSGSQPQNQFSFLLKGKRSRSQFLLTGPDGHVGQEGEVKNFLPGSGRSVVLNLGPVSLILPRTEPRLVIL